MLLLSILIPTLEDRKPLFDKMVSTLQSQIAGCHAEEEVEIVPLLDKGEKTIGTKRNELLCMARGLFSVFIDDDDPVPETYVQSFIDVIRVYKDEIDCIGIFELVFFQENFGGLGMHTLLCGAWTEGNGFYFRHLDQRTPVKTVLARSIKYRDVRWSEDHFWSVDAANSGIFRKEVFLAHKPLYLYHCGSPKKGL